MRWLKELVINMRQNIISFITVECFNHVIGWDKAKIMDREQNRNRRLIKESIWIRKRGHKTFNRDEGNYIVPHIYD